MGSEPHAYQDKLKLVAVALSLFASWGLHDFIQEAVFARPGFTYGLFMALCLQVSAVVGATLTAHLRRQGAGSSGVAKPDDPTSPDTGQGCATPPPGHAGTRAAAPTSPQAFDLEQPQPPKKTLQDSFATHRGAHGGQAAEVAALAEQRGTAPLVPEGQRSPPMQALARAAAADGAAEGLGGWWGGRTEAVKVGALYVLLAGTLAASNGLSNTALNYVNMPAKVLFKSSKLIPVIVIGTLLRTEKYTWLDYGSALGVCAGLMVFSVSDVTASAQFSAIGVIFLCTASAADGLAPNIQKYLLGPAMQQTREQVVSYSNWLSASLTLVTLVLTGQLSPAVSFIMLDTTCAQLLFVQSMVGYLGIMTYMYSIDAFGPSATIVMTSIRKMLSIVLSYFYFRKPLQWGHCLGVALVLGAVTLQGIYKRKK